MLKQLISLLSVSFIMLVLSVKAFPSNGNTGVNVINISYGTGSDIAYNLNTGTYDVFTNGKKIIYNAFSLVKNNEQSISSKDYNQINFHEDAVKDGFGVGKKYTIILSKSGLPQMEQVFYVYPGHDYFFTEVLIRGSDLKSNYMAPLVANQANIYTRGDNRTLFVPFDNDAFIRYNAKSMNAIMERNSKEIVAERTVIKNSPLGCGLYAS